MQIYQKQRDIFSRKFEKNTEIEALIEKNVDRDILLFKGDSHNGVRELIRRLNPFTKTKNAKSQCKQGFKRLAEAGLGKLTQEKSRNRISFLHFKKLPCSTIASNLSTAETFPKYISVIDYESSRNNPQDQESVEVDEVPEELAEEDKGLKISGKRPRHNL